MKKSTQLIISSTVGIVFMLAILILAVIYPCPTSSQYNIFRIILSISVGAFASIIPGLFDFKYSGIVSATGAIAVFAFVYLYDPAKLVVSDDCSSDLYLSGTVYINGKETKNIDVRVGQLKKSTVTDEYGAFKIEYPKKETKLSYNFRVSNNGSLDTSFEIANTDWHDLKFKFTATVGSITVNPKSVSDNITVPKIPTNTPKKEISNYFEGSLPESSTAFYGGQPYCNFAMKYTDIKVQIKLSKDLKYVEIAKVTFKAIEKANDGCPYQTGAPNTHIYDLQNSQISGDNIFISFNPDRSNNPSSTLSLSGIIRGNKITASLISDRIDMPDPKLVYKIRLDMQLERTE